MSDVSQPETFLSSVYTQDVEYSVSNGIMTFDNKKDNPTNFKYFVRVCGGWRGFMTLKEARAYYNEKY